MKPNEEPKIDKEVLNVPINTPSSEVPEIDVINLVSEIILETIIKEIDERNRIPQDQ